MYYNATEVEPNFDTTAPIFTNRHVLSCLDFELGEYQYTKNAIPAQAQCHLCRIHSLEASNPVVEVTLKQAIYPLDDGLKLRVLCDDGKVRRFLSNSQHLHGRVMPIKGYVKIGTVSVAGFAYFNPAGTLCFRAYLYGTHAKLIRSANPAYNRVTAEVPLLTGNSSEFSIDTPLDVSTMET